jgi:conjugal transfer pilus assembly protein TraB
MFDFSKIKKYFSGNGESSDNLNDFMKKKQGLIGISVLGFLVLGTVVLHSLAVSKHKASPIVDNNNKATAVDGILSTDFTQKDELSALEQQQDQVDALKKQLANLSKSSEDDMSSQRDSLIKEIKLIIANNNKSTATKLPAKPLANLTASADEPFSDNMQSNDGSDINYNNQIETIKFNYTVPNNVSNNVPIKDVSLKNDKTYVPAGTFATSVLLEGADTNASVNGQSDTSPILVRILTDGTLPNGHHSYLRGCFVLASMYGDISSERGEARLTNISCTRPDGSILERKVEGYLSFAGKEGIKGRPVMRNGKILMMAGMSGMLSGFGSAMQSSTQMQSISPLGATTTINPNKVFESGAYGGASTGMNQLANYYIKRADQYHPIIEIGSGTVATVIFQSGFSLVDDTNQPNTANNVAENNDNSDDEMRAILKQAQAEQLSKSQSSAPFSNVN